MIFRTLGLASFMVIGAISSIFAQTVPAVWSFGSVFYAEVPQNINSSCLVQPGPSSFAFTGNQSVSLISVPQVGFTGKGISYNVGGLAQMNFASSTSGTMAFDALPEIDNGGQPRPVVLRFVDFADTYNADNNTLAITMVLIFPANAAAGGRCVLRFRAFYRQP